MADENEKYTMGINSQKPTKGKLQSPTLNNIGNDFFTWVALICLLVFFFFRASGLPVVSGVKDTVCHSADTQQTVCHSEIIKYITINSKHSFFN